MKIAASLILSDLDSGFKHQMQQNLDFVNDLLAQAATVVEIEAKTTAAFADKTGNLRKSIKKRKSKYPDGGYIVSATGKNKDKGYHAHLVEYGHVFVAWGKPTGKRVQPYPFMRPAEDKGRAWLMSKIGSGK